MTVIEILEAALLNRRLIRTTYTVSDSGVYSNRRIVGVRANVNRLGDGVIDLLLDNATVVQIYPDENIDLAEESLFSKSNQASDDWWR